MHVNLKQYHIGAGCLSTLRLCLDWRNKGEKVFNMKQLSRAQPCIRGRVLSTVAMPPSSYEDTWNEINILFLGNNQETLPDTVLPPAENFFSTVSQRRKFKVLKSFSQRVWTVFVFSPVTTRTIPTSSLIQSAFRKLSTHNEIEKETSIGIVWLSSAVVFHVYVCCSSSGVFCLHAQL